MRIAIVGAGAVGGYFGGLLHRAGRDVTFLVRPTRAKLLREQGLTVIEPGTEWTITPKVVTSDEIDAPFDAVLLAVKAYTLRDAIVDITRAVGPETLVVPGLNGMAHLDQLRAAFGHDRVLGGVVMIASTLDEEGRIVHLNETPGSIVYGEFVEHPGTALDEFDESMQDAVFNARRSDSIEQDMWNKWVGLAALGATTCLLRGTTGEIASAPGGIEVATGILAECAAVAAASGSPPAPSVLERSTDMLTDPARALTSSLYRDFSAGNPIEGEQIVGDLVTRGRALGVEVPLLSLTATLLSVAERRRLG
jgi:2-dehydropantoate 2-reductase